MTTAEQVERLAALRTALAEVMDPELPFVSLVDLGVLRGVRLGDRGQVVVELTPTYSGCPALAAMTEDVVAVLARCGVAGAEVRISLLPAWSTDDLTEHGRAQLAAAGIAPPGRSTPPVVGLGPTRLLLGRTTATAPACPRCGSGDTEELSRFAATSCQSLWRCTSCREPFPHFKQVRP